MRSASFAFAALGFGSFLVGCPNDPPRHPAGESPASTAVVASAGPTNGGAPPLPVTAETIADSPEVVVAPNGEDPLHGQFTLADATAGLPGDGPLVAMIHTSEGDLQCTLDSQHAPITVANFVGLARGKRPFKRADGAWVRKPAYDKLTFHRIIKGFMIQGGDPEGTGTGGPGYVFQDENREGKHDRAGLLCMANRGPDTNGMQFFITDAPTSQLDGRNTSYTVFGECSPTSVVHAIANVPTGTADRPIRTVEMTTVRIGRLH